uniref:Major facilitator superfamily (MFS) profile domain-containing protein n=1 Tax=Acrobeloides nanus TaxID=290746 RepID=A0A914CP86_9BILA
MEFGYFCETTIVVKSSITYQMVGLIIGALIFGQISDTYGRKPTLLIAILISNVFNVASSFTNSLFWFTLLRFFVNLCNAGSIAVLPIYSLEMLPPKDRYWINNVVGGAPVFIAYALVAYFSGDWRTLARVTSILVIPAFIVSM